MVDTSRSHRGVASVLASAGLLADAYDRRGYGASPVPGSRTIGGGVEDLVTIIGDRADVVVGHSFGGLIALAAAAARPELVGCVVAYEPVFPWCPTWSDTYTSYMSQFSRTEGSEIVEHYGLPERYLNEMSGASGDFEATYSHPAPFTLSEVDVPALILQSDTTSHLAETAAWVAAQSDRFRLTVVDGAGHDGHMTHYGQVGQNVLDFLEHA